MPFLMVSSISFLDTQAVMPQIPRGVQRAHLPPQLSFSDTLNALLLASSNTMSGAY